MVWYPAKPEARLNVFALFLRQGRPGAGCSIRAFPICLPPLGAASWCCTMCADFLFSWLSSSTDFPSSSREVSPACFVQAWLLRFPSGFKSYLAFRGSPLPRLPPASCIPRAPATPCALLVIPVVPPVFRCRACGLLLFTGAHICASPHLDVAKECRTCLGQDVLKKSTTWQLHHRSKAHGRRAWRRFVGT